MQLSLRLSTGLMLAGSLAGCSTAPTPPPLSAEHPASPDAVESPFPVPSRTLALDSTSFPVLADHAMQQPEMHHHGDRAATPPSPATKPGENAALSAPRYTPTTAPTTMPTTAAAIYTCPMHKQVASDHPGRCPICGMKLVPKSQVTGRPQGERHNHSSEGSHQ
jgi:hypothetical protein